MKNRKKASELTTLRKRNIALIEEVEQLKKSANTSKKLIKKPELRDIVIRSCINAIQSYKGSPDRM